MARTIKITDPFARTVEHALEHFGDPMTLGTLSPLAAPYVLGKHLTPTVADTPRARGQTLQTLLMETAQVLPTEQRALLDVSFFRRDASLNNTGVARVLDMAETTYYRHRASAIEALAHEVNRAVLPPLRTEVPRTTELVGQDDVMRTALITLGTGNLIALIGPAGIGKSALGAALAARWSGRAFWFTLRPDDADVFTHVVFALGYFLRQLGFAHTWRQLVADGGRVHEPRVLGLLRHDLHTAQIQSQPVLICLDEMNVLRNDIESHIQLSRTIDALRGVAPMVLMGQHVDISCDTVIPLEGLNLESTQALTPGMSRADATALHRVTHGNPTLIRLAQHLRTTGEPMADVLRILADTPSIELLLQRLWGRLHDEERAASAALCVFRTGAPRDAWPQWQTQLNGLGERGLLTDDGMGGVALIPAMRMFVRQRLSDDTVIALHQQTGELLAARGEYTEAAFHFVHGQKPNVAIWLWLNHHELEIGHGHAADARALFSRIDIDRLDDATKRGLAVLRAEQLLLAGDAEPAEMQLAQHTWPADHALTPWARQLLGDALERQGRIDQAATQYREALLSLDTIESRAHRQGVGIHVRRGYLFVNRLPNLSEAQRDADLALWRAHNFSGHVAQESGRYDVALNQYKAALTLAEHANDQIVLARTHQHLGALYVRMGRADSAIESLHIALQIDDTIGDPMNKLFDLLNLSSAYVVAQRYEDALVHAVDGLSLAREIGHGFLVSGLNASAGEASFYLNRLDDAEQFALACVREEEEAFRPLALTVLAWVRQAQNDLDAAVGLLQQAIASAQAIDDDYAEAAAWKSLGDVRTAQTHAADAHAAYDCARKLFHALGLQAEVTAIELVLAKGLH